MQSLFHPNRIAKNLYKNSQNKNSLKLNSLSLDPLKLGDPLTWDYFYKLMEEPIYMRGNATQVDKVRHIA